MCCYSTRTRARDEQEGGGSTRGAAGSKVCAVGGDAGVRSLRERFEGKGKQPAVPPALAQNRLSSTQAAAARAWDKDNATKGHERRNSGRRSSTVQPKAQVCDAHSVLKALGLVTVL
jgi:hypothetical protein